MDNILFNFYRGTTYTRDFTISGWSFPISKAYFTVKEDTEKKKPVLQKTLNEGITLISDENGVKTFNLLICCRDTDHMKTDVDYIFDITIISDGVDGEIIRKKPITGIVRLKGSATRPCNEC